ncbi:hypothetical protein [Nocardioides sp. URHA0020]|uniref:hypothetical protein n=1 Tax=Nocardioides sp. URHA0020 TaxID=1380392 RepID=UPI00048F3F36|nr:hypothetical protein [Nocardioides sp. URHA0020]
MLVFLSPVRLQLCLALLCALTGTWWGIGTALMVLAVLAARTAARRHVASWSSTPLAHGSISLPPEAAPLPASRRAGHVRA